MACLKTLSIVFFVTFFLFAACNKKEESSKTKTQLITAAPWKFSQVGLDLDSNGTIDQPLRPDLISVCSTDNAFTFYEDGTGMLDEGINQCITPAPRFTPYTWNFLNNETEIFMSVNIFPLYGGNLKIVELSDSRFVVSKQVGIHGFPSYLTIVVVFLH